MSSNDEPTDVQLDISKYEGHTPAPWEADLDDEGKRWIDAYDDEGDINLCRITNGNKADAQLIADAPLLLEEVKRLRNKIRLLDIVEDRDGTLDRILLNSGVLTEKELKGAYSDSELEGVEFHN